jgi:hypothetical protein
MTLIKCLFCQADVSIAMEPMHTRAQTKGRLALGGRQPPLAIGASLVSLPCGLFMQYETSLYALTQLTREARRLLNGVRMVRSRAWHSAWFEGNVFKFGVFFY